VLCVGLCDIVSMADGCQLVGVRRRVSLAPWHIPCLYAAAGHTFVSVPSVDEVTGARIVPASSGKVAEWRNVE